MQGEPAADAQAGRRRVAVEGPALARAAPARRHPVERDEPAGRIEIERLGLPIAGAGEADHRIGQADEQRADADARRESGRGAVRRSVDLGRGLGREQGRGAGPDVHLEAQVIAADQAAAVGRREHPGGEPAIRRRQPLERALGVGARDRAAARARGHRDQPATGRRSQRSPPPASRSPRHTPTPTRRGW